MIYNQASLHYTSQYGHLSVVEYLDNQKTQINEIDKSLVIKLITVHLY